MATTAPTTGRRFRFGDYELDTHTGELGKAGVRRRLHGQPIQVLAILLQNKGELVTGEELKNQLWPADTFVDFDHSLHNAVARIRETLGDSVDNPQYIETLHFSPAYSGLAETYICLALFGQGELSAPKGFGLAREAVRKALELDPNNGEAYDALGSLDWHAEYDWKAAAESFSKAIALAPSNSCAHEDRAIFLALMGRREEALAEVEESKVIDPGPDSAGAESAVYFRLREWGRLIESSRAQLASNPNDWRVHSSLGVGYEGTGKLPEAVAEYQKAIELSKGDLDSVASLAHAYAVAGRRSDAELILHGLEQKSRDGKASPYLPATIYAGLGEKDKAFKLVEKAYREKSLDVAWILKPDLRTDSLRSDPRFNSLLQRVGLSQ